MTWLRASGKVEGHGDPGSDQPIESDSCFSNNVSATELIFFFFLPDNKDDVSASNNRSSNSSSAGSVNVGTSGSKALLCVFQRRHAHVCPERIPPTKDVKSFQLDQFVLRRSVTH